MKKLLYLLAFAPISAFSQSTIFNNVENSQAFQHMEIGGVLGTTGLGIDVAFPLNKNLKLRAGFSTTPTISFVDSYSMTAVGGDQLSEGSEPLETKTERLSKYLGELIHNEDVDNIVDMDHKYHNYNAKLLIDWYPFKKKNWHFTGGFYAGSKKIGNVCNTIQESPTTLAMLMYNDMYDQIQGLDEWEYPTFSLGSYSFSVDPFTGMQLKERFNYYGRVAVQLGSFDDGNAFFIDPDANGLLKAEAYVNAFKPYVGFGYNTRIGKDHRWNIGFDAGLMFWGTPHVYCDGYKFKADETEYADRIERQERVCLIHDVQKVRGIVGDYMNIVKHLPFLPVIEAKLSYTIF